MSRSFYSFTLLTVLSLTAGCGEWGGGAAVVPSVVFVQPGASADSEGLVESAADPGTSTEPGGVGSLVGRVIFRGNAPNLPPQFTKGSSIKDQEVCAAVDMVDDRLRIGANNGVADVFIYIPRKPRGLADPETSDEALIFDQKYCRFIPHCMVVPTGRTLKVLSDDPVAHNTHTYPDKNQPVNSGVAPNDREGGLTIVYKRAESAPIEVKCDFHAWMKAYHLPIDHHIAAVTDQDGNFEIGDIPAGTYEFAIWHESADGQYIERKREIEIKGGEPTKVEIDYPESKLAL